ncbi:MAG: hypothetical protein J6J65_04155 [Opitutales bacterium]|jgi:hypothetical protein|nr:hypothetical protein [Opitutales bacterium]
MMLTEQQKEAVRKWVGEGRGVSEIQKLISSEFGIDMLYMDVRFLIDDIGAEIPAAGGSPAPDAQQPVMAADSSGLGDSVGVRDDVSAGGVRVSVSPIQRPGTVMSGDVVFSDGGKAEWVLDNAGRLGLNPETEGYSPPQQDLPEFQNKLREALGMGGA